MGKMDRHAYCILAHNDEYLLKKLIECLDHHRNDIYIHFDRKSDLHSLNLKSKYSKIHIIRKEDSIDVQWGGYSLVEAEMLVLKKAYSEGDYSYFHLLSGADLPIKSQAVIHDYFDKLPQGTNLIGFRDYETKDRRNMMKRVVPYHFFKNKYRHPNKLLRLFYRGFEEIASQAQRILGLKINPEIEFRKGCNWVSLTNDFTKYLITQESFIKDTFGKSIICDELFIHTIIWNSQFRSTILDLNDEYAGCMREIDWNRGKPYTWRMENFDELMNSSKLFARKFSTTVDKDIIDNITKAVTQ